MLSIVEKDLGTPKRESTELVTLTIDGQQVTVPAGTSVMRAAALTDVKIPKLCATEQLEAFGSCRLCLVQIEGMKGLPASCTTPVAAGMKVTTQNKQLGDIRRGVMELYISDHPLDCLTCPANGHCELQDMAGVVGLREVRYGYEGANHLKAEKDESNPYFTFDASKCIVCSRCVRACDEQQGTLGAHHPESRLRVHGFCQPKCLLHGLRVRILRRLRAGLPHRHAVGKNPDREGSGPSTASPPPAPIAAWAAPSVPR